MKSAIILVLLVALLGGAALSRPTQDSFKQYITAKYTQSDKGLLTTGWDQFRADNFFNSCTFNNRIFWTDVQKDGKSIYTGAFSTWFSRADIAKELQKVQNAAGSARQQVDQIKNGK
jgi:hypothetical protein